MEEGLEKALSGAVSKVLAKFKKPGRCDDTYTSDFAPTKTKNKGETEISPTLQIINESMLIYIRNAHLFQLYIR